MEDAALHQRMLEDLADRHLGSIAVSMINDPDTEHHGEMLARATLVYDGGDTEPDESLPTVVAHLELAAPDYRKFDDRFVKSVGHVLEGLLYESGYRLWGPHIVPGTPPRDWRAQILAAVENNGPVNQAIIAPLPDVFPVLDRMRFRSGAEEEVYKALKRRQDNSPSGELLIAVNPAVRVRGRTWEVDFLITHRGRAGVLEVDGMMHKKRYAADVSRDRILRDHGVAYVERVVTEDITDDLAADEIVEGFLRRLLA